MQYSEDEHCKATAHSNAETTHHGQLPRPFRSTIDSNARYHNPLTIENNHVSLLALIDAVYPPLHCPQCDAVSRTRQEQQKHFLSRHPPRYTCLHPHCDLHFKSKGALRFHMSQVHLTHQISIIDSLPTTPTAASPPTPPAVAPATTTVPSPSPSPPPPAIQKPSLSPPLQPHPQHNAAPSWRVSSFGRPATTSRAPRGSKKIILSPESERLLNSVYDPLQCPSCHQHFNRKTNVIKHLTDQHYGEEPYRCVFPKCVHPKLYATREGLVYHILRAHDQQSDSSSSSTSNPNKTQQFTKRRRVDR